MIRQLTRPFTVKQLQQLLNTFGTIVEGGFWIDNIKSTCIVKVTYLGVFVVGLHAFLYAFMTFRDSRFKSFHALTHAVCCF